MKLIIAGPPKTGTTSMCAALRRLGYVVYDSDEQVDLQLDDWYDILVRGHDPLDHFARMFANVDAVTDSPAFYFWEQLLTVFPDAKVVLLTRDETSWVASYRYQKDVEARNRWLTWLSPKLSKIFVVVDAVERLCMGSEVFVDYLYRWKFRLHNERVKSVVPKSRLLVCSVKDGWGPICEFLGLREPHEEFPHANQGGGDYEREFISLRNELLGAFLFKTSVVLGTVGLIAYGLKRFRIHM